MTRILSSLLAAVTVVAIYWVGGGEFERGWPMAMCLMYSIVAIGACYMYPD
jgi:hypothetical protein